MRHGDKYEKTPSRAGWLLSMTNLLNTAFYYPNEDIAPLSLVLKSLSRRQIRALLSRRRYFLIKVGLFASVSKT